jgi:hypothetical protein
MLNTHYERIVVAEAFNGDGKTDILIREEDKTLPIPRSMRALPSPGALKKSSLLEPVLGRAFLARPSDAHGRARK